MRPGPPQDDVRGVREALAEAERLGGDGHVVRALVDLSDDALTGQGRLREAADVALRGVEVTGRLGIARTDGAFLVGNAAEPLVRPGAWGRADALMQDARALDPPGVCALHLHTLSADLAGARGRREETAAHLAAAQRILARSFVGAQYRLPLDRLAAQLELGAARPERAAALAAEALLSAGGGRARAVRQRARGRRALRLAAARGVRPRRPRAGPARPRPRRPGRVGRPARRSRRGGAAPARPGSRRRGTRWGRPGPRRCAPSWPRRRAPRRSPCGTPPWRRRGHEEPYALAVALERAAAARAAAGERAGAREAAEEAQRLARDLGAAPLLTAVALVARSTGLVLAPAGPAPAPQVPAAPRPDLGLTPRELEVLRLVAQGRSNRQVGEELVISTMTASVHVSRIIAKLGVSGRGEAAAVAHRLGVVDPAP